MKKLIMICTAIFVITMILGAGCRPPELEGVVININQKQYEKAYDLAKEAVQKYPDNPEAWYYLGELHGRFEKFEEMSEAFDKSLSLAQTYKSEIEQQRMK